MKSGRRCVVIKKITTAWHAGYPGAERDRKQAGDWGKDEGEQGSGTGGCNDVFRQTDVDIMAPNFNMKWGMKEKQITQVRRLKIRRDELLALKQKAA